MFRFYNGDFVIFVIADLERVNEVLIPHSMTVALSPGAGHSQRAMPIRGKLSRTRILSATVMVPPIQRVATVQNLPGRAISSRRAFRFRIFCWRLAFIDDLNIVAVRIKHPGRIIARIVFETNLR
jgi:hypothetical protein